MHKFRAAKSFYCSALTYEIPYSINMSEEDIEHNPHILRPLAVHLGLAMAEYEVAGRAAGVPKEQLEKMLLGIRKYQNHPFRRPKPDYVTLYQSGQARLLTHKNDEAAPSLILVPSLINRSPVLDLLPGRSFLSYLNQNGHKAALLDWGEPRQDANMERLDDLLTTRFLPAIEFAAENNGAPVSALGYCMGGTLLAAAAHLRPDLFDRLIFLASPWDFHAGNRKMLDSVAAGTPAALTIMAQKNYLPMNWIQSVFAAVNADRAAEKFASFADMQGGPREEIFVATEDWLNDGVDLGAPIARACITEWYGENRPGRGLWHVAGQAIDLRNLAHKSLIIASPRDRLVPIESSLAMKANLQNASLLSPDAGHVGMMTGSAAPEKVWLSISKWLLD